MTHQAIEDLRHRIDEIDGDLVRLIAERARIASRIGEIKSSKGMETLDPSRESSVIRSALKGNRGPLSNRAVKGIFTEIISACREIQAPTKISYLGPQGAFSHFAAMSHFGASCDFISTASIPQVFEQVERMEAGYGVAPVENSTEGPVHVTLDMLAGTGLTICGEIVIPIRHAIMSLSDDLSSVQTVVSHPQALAQCRKRLGELAPMALLKEAPSTARAAELAAESESVAALGSQILADLYGLNILKTNVQDIAANQTRFLVMGRSSAVRTGSDKTSIMFSAPHEPGALCKVLAELGDHGLNMTKIVSRPSKRTPWEYVFFVDFYGHMDEPGVARALERMSALSLGMKILGSYPPASTMEEDKARDESGFSPINSGLSKSQRIDTQSLANIS